MLSGSTAVTSSPSSSSARSISPVTKLDLSARRNCLKLNFQRSISEPQGQTTSPDQGGVVCPPADLVLTSSSLHPSKRCRMMMVNEFGLSTRERFVSSTARPPPEVTTTSKNESITQNVRSSSSSFLLRPPPPPPGSVSLPASPCCESSTLQRALLIQNAQTVDANGLASKLRQQQPLQQSGCASNNDHYLLIDCRPFIACNISHIRGAINVNCCNRYNRRRLQQGKSALADLATTKEGKELLRKRNWKEVVVYDDCSESLENLPASHALFLVMNALVEDDREPVMLLGGIRDFKAAHRSLCEDHLVQTSGDADLSPDEICDDGSTTKDIENYPATQVLPHLYLGNMRDASDGRILRDLGIGYVLNVTSKEPSYQLDCGVRHKQLLASDDGSQNLRQFFDEAFEFIDSAERAGSRVLVHCQAGVSRSPTIAVAYLMKKRNPTTMAEAYKFVKAKRRIISPNLNFMGQLYEFEQGLLKNRNDAAAASNAENQTDDAKKQKSSLAAAIEHACNAAAAAAATNRNDLWAEKVVASSTTKTRINSGSV